MSRSPLEFGSINAYQIIVRPVYTFDTSPSKLDVVDAFISPIIFVCRVCRAVKKQAATPAGAFGALAGDTFVFVNGDDCIPIAVGLRPMNHVPLQNIKTCGLVD